MRFNQLRHRRDTKLVEVTLSGVKNESEPTPFNLLIQVLIIRM